MSRIACCAAILSLALPVAAVYPARAAAPPSATAAPRPTAVPTAARPQPANAYPTVPKEKPSPKSSALGYSGNPVDFELTGLEPDFDPIYKVIVSTKLHDLRSKTAALPDATLIFSAYLEVFQPDTTPVLPDLLHPDKPASDLSGFLSGTAAVVNQGGHVVYKGSLLAEIFQNSTERLIVDLDPITAHSGWGSVRLQGSIVLHKGGRETGTIEALQPLARDALAVPHGHAPTWRAVISSLTVHIPAMMGTAGTLGKTRSATPATNALMAPTKPTPAPCTITCRLSGVIAAVVHRPLITAPITMGVILLALTGIPLIRRKARTRPPPEAGG